MEIRYPYAAGYFYPASRDNLIEELKRCFLDKKFGPGILPEEYFYDKLVYAGIVPHAGYTYSGPCAAYFYLKLTGTKPNTIIILGTNHTGYGENISMLVTKKWMTPLGIVNTDVEFGKYLQNIGIANESEEAHLLEHSIEVQLPFLQYVYKNHRFKIVPIVLKDLEYEDIKDLAHSIFNAAREFNRKILVIASSDFTHYGASYGYLPFVENVRENMYKLDRYFIEPILKLDAREFLNRIYEKDATVCGYLAIATVIEYSKLVEAKATLLKYYTSADVTGDWDLAVGYASIEFSS